MFKKIALLAFLAVPSLALAGSLTYTPIHYIFGFKKQYANFEEGRCALTVKDIGGNRVLVTYTSTEQACAQDGSAYGIFENCTSSENVQ